MLGVTQAITWGLFYLPGSYDPLFWGFAMLSASAAAVVLLVRESAGHPEAESRITWHS